MSNAQSIKEPPKSTATLLQSSWSYKEIHILPKQQGRLIDAAFVFEQEEEAYFTNLGLVIGIDFG
ncbi:MAG TPA: hypothetical protein DCE56_00510 [Cyanobacteria bacterium UBA8553]|nr:hypothetical protein [Cyanobacteria bacterium UBA8553]